MSYFPHFDSHLIGERNEGLLREVSTCRLEKRLRKDHELRGSRLATLTKRGKLLVGGARLAQ